MAVLERSHQKKRVKVCVRVCVCVCVRACVCACNRSVRLVVWLWFHSTGEEGMEEGEKAVMDITDKTDSKVLGVRRTIYLTIMSRLGDSSN